jgi:hypothetical protein
VVLVLPVGAARYCASTASRCGFSIAASAPPRIWPFIFRGRAELLRVLLRGLVDQRDVLRRGSRPLSIALLDAGRRLRRRLDAQAFVRRQRPHIGRAEERVALQVGRGEARAAVGRRRDARPARRLPPARQRRPLAGQLARHVGDRGLIAGLQDGQQVLAGFGLVFGLRQIPRGGVLVRRREVLQAEFLRLLVPGRADELVAAGRRARRLADVGPGGDRLGDARVIGIALNVLPPP